MTIREISRSPTSASGGGGSTTNLTLHLDPAAIADGEDQVWLSSEYLGRMQLDGVTPTPDQVTDQDGGYVYTFLVDGADDSLAVTFNLTIDSMGPVTGHVGLAGEEPIVLNHFFTP